MNLKIFILVALVIAGISGRRMSRIGNRGVAKAGSYLGDALTSLINIFREKPQPMPKNYKR